MPLAGKLVQYRGESGLGPRLSISRLAPVSFMVTYRYHQAASTATFGLKHLNPDEGFSGSFNLGELGCYAWFLLSSTLSVLVL